jgi:hypothetical protein
LIPYICTINEANMGIQIKRVMEDMMSHMAGKTGNKRGESYNPGWNYDVSVRLTGIARWRRICKSVAG